MKLYYGGFADYKEFVVADSEEQAIFKVGIKVNAPFLPITVEEIAEVDGFKIQIASIACKIEELFPITEEATEEAIETSDAETFRCKKCGTVFENRGQFLAHHRSAHPKGD